MGNMHVSSGLMGCSVGRNTRNKETRSDPVWLTISWDAKHGMDRGLLKAHKERLALSSSFFTET